MKTIINETVKLVNCRVELFDCSGTAKSVVLEISESVIYDKGHNLIEKINENSGSEELS